MNKNLIIGIGYPIWWGIAAWPVDTFVKANDFNVKTVIPFCTSSSSGLGRSGEMLADMYICANQDLGGNYTPEMQSLNDNMVTYFGNGNNGKFTKEYIQEIARQKMSREARPGSNLPTIKGKSKGFGKSKAQIQTLRQENSFIAQKLSSIRRNSANVSPVEKYNPEKDAFAIFRKKLKSIIAHITPDNDDHSHSREEFEFTLEDL